MRILMLGAGGIGGYFGSRIHIAGGDVTFLVREARAKNLLEKGLHVLSPCGDVKISPKIVTSLVSNAGDRFDVVVLSCKAYDLNAALDSVSIALDSDTLILPLLNGIAHLSYLDDQFGREKVLGGIAHLGVTVTPTGEIKHLNNFHRLVIGSRNNSCTSSIAHLAEILARTGIDFSLSENIEREMWDKFIFLTTLAAATCTMRCSIGDILNTYQGEAFIVGLLNESIAVSVAYGHIPCPSQFETYQSQLTERGSTSTCSMLRDIERGARTEAEHILGDMVHRASAKGVETPLLQIAYSHLQAYEFRRNRECD